MIEIAALCDFLDGKVRYEAGKVYSVLEEDAARFIFCGWATDPEGRIVCPDGPKPDHHTIDPDDGVLGSR